MMELASKGMDRRMQSRAVRGHYGVYGKRSAEAVAMPDVTNEEVKGS